MIQHVDNIEFIKGVDFEMIKSLPETNASKTKTLLNFDDSSKEILKASDCTMLATAGRQKIFFIKAHKDVMPSFNKRMYFYSIQVTMRITPN